MPRHFVRPLSSAPALPLDQGAVTLAFEDELACLPGINATSDTSSSLLGGCFRTLIYRRPKTGLDV